MTPEQSAALIHRGRRIRDRRVRLGIRRKELAKKIGISYDYMAGIENGHKRGAPETIVAIAGALEIPATSTFIDPLRGKVRSTTPPAAGAA